MGYLVLKAEWLLVVLVNQHDACVISGYCETSAKYEEIQGYRDRGNCHYAMGGKRAVTVICLNFLC